MKKIIALVLALVMVLSLATVAFARPHHDNTNRILSKHYTVNSDWWKAGVENIMNIANGLLGKVDDAKDAAIDANNKVGGIVDTLVGWLVKSADEVKGGIHYRHNDSDETRDYKEAQIQAAGMIRGAANVIGNFIDKVLVQNAGYVEDAAWKATNDIKDKTVENIEKWNGFFGREEFWDNLKTWKIFNFYDNLVEKWTATERTEVTELKIAEEATSTYATLEEISKLD